MGRFSGYQASYFLGIVSWHRKLPEWPVTQARNLVSCLKSALHIVKTGDSPSEISVHVSGLDDHCGFLQGASTWGLPPPFCLFTQHSLPGVQIQAAPSKTVIHYLSSPVDFSRELLCTSALRVHGALPLTVSLGRYHSLGLGRPPRPLPGQFPLMLQASA